MTLTTELQYRSVSALSPVITVHMTTEYIYAPVIIKLCTQYNISRWQQYSRQETLAQANPGIKHLKHMLNSTINCADIIIYTHLHGVVTRQSVGEKTYTQQRKTKCNKSSFWIKM